MTRTSNPIVIRETYRAPVEVVWRAITDKEHMRKWFFDSISEFEPRPGFETQFNVHAEGEDYLHLWRVTEAVVNRRIAYDWKYPGYAGESDVVWELSESAEGTELTLTHTGVDSFPQDKAVFTREACEGGWRYFLGERLKAFLE